MNPPDLSKLRIDRSSPLPGARKQRRGWIRVLVIAVGILIVLCSSGYLRREGAERGEYYALLTAAGGGMIFFVSAGNLMTLFLGLEWFSIALYILCAIDIDRESRLEAGMKYLIAGSFGSAFLLFGSALVYGATGTLRLDLIGKAIADRGLSDDPLVVTGLAMIEKLAKIMYG